MDGIGIKDIIFIVQVNGINHTFPTLFDAVNFARAERVKGNLDITLFSSTTYYGW